MTNKLVKYFEKMSSKKIILICILGIFLIGTVDYYFPSRLSTALFYVLPIALASWFSNFNMGILVSIIATIVWCFCEQSFNSLSFISIWNTLFRMIFFLTVTFLISGFRERFNEEENFADTDPLTGALNKRSFNKQIDLEIDRARRYKFPCSLAYIDLDHFKSVNDTYGHSEGDRLLKAVVKTLKEHTRSIDLVARLGGDEFAIMLIGTDMNDSDTAIRKIQLKLLEKMHAFNWDVTFSIGVVSFDIPPETADEIISMADDLMYTVKNNSKNNIAHIFWPEQSG